MTGSGEGVVTGVSTDSRTIRKGELFVALRGERHDGHDHLAEVFGKGASAALVDRPVTTRIRHCVRVKDTLRALGDLAHDWRMRFPVPVVAVTGSNGKTTTKDMIARVLARRFRVLKTEGNFNNLIGLPLTLFRLGARAEIAVLEMGMNREGEIDRLAAIAEPEVGVITNIARAHLEGLGSLERIVRAKGELLRRLPAKGLAILNADTPRFTQLRKAVRSRLVTFGSAPRATVRLVSCRLRDLKGLDLTVRLHAKDHPFHLPILGRHNAANALAALAVGDHFGIPVAAARKSLSRFQTGSKRMEILRLRRRIDLINDSYNANPDSTAASLEFLEEAGAGRRRVAVLGEMLELGRFSAKAHREVGLRAARSRADLLFAVGDHAEETLRGATMGGLSPKAVAAFGTVAQAIRALRSAVRPGDLVLVKGSRGMRMERISEALQERYGVH